MYLLDSKPPAWALPNLGSRPRQSVRKALRRFGVRGFSLIEMIVVVAIILILATIAFPVIRAMFTQGSISKSTANLRQIYTAIQLTVTDNKGNYPHAVIPADAEGNNFTRANAMWAEAVGRILYPEIRESLPPGIPWMFTGVHNPNGYRDTVFQTPEPEPDASIRIASYGYNELLLPRANGSRSFGLLFSPSKTGLIADNSGRTHSLSPNWANARINARYGASGPHASNGRATALFLDGHVELLSAGEVQQINSNPLHPFWGILQQ